MRLPREGTPHAGRAPCRQNLNTRLPLRPTMSWGMRNRIGRIIRGDGHAVMLAVDHGYFMGPTSRLENPRKAITPLLPFTDALMVTRGVLRSSVDPTADVPVVLRVSGGTSILKEDLSNESVMTS